MRHNPLPQRRVWPALLLGAVLLTTPAHGRKSAVPLPGGAVELTENLYRSPLGYDATLKWLIRRMAKQGIRLRFERAVDLPDVVAAHAKSPSSRTRWQGLNVSHYAGSTKIFIILRQP